MKKYLKYIFFILLVLFIANSYKFNSSAYIANKTWKYSGGFPSGDFIQFELDSNNNRKLKKIGRDSVDITFCFGKYLFVRNKESGKFGYYYLKNR